VYTRIAGGRAEIGPTERSPDLLAGLKWRGLCGRERRRKGDGVKEGEGGREKERREGRKGNLLRISSRGIDVPHISIY